MLFSKNYYKTILNENGWYFFIVITDDFDFGSYAPTVGVNSRSGSMKYFYILLKEN